MASTQTRPNRLLGEVLQEEQEPFILEVYLSERGYMKSRAISEPSKVLRSQKGVVPCSSKLLKYVYRKLLLMSKSLSINNCGDEDGEVVVSCPEITRNCISVMASHNFFSASRTSVHNSCPESDKDQASISSCKQREDEAPTDRNSQKVSKASVAQVHETTPQRKNIPKCQKEMSRVKKVREESRLSTSLWELLVTEKPGCFQEQQNKQLLFDYVREIIGNHGRERGELLGRDALIFQKIREWGKTSMLYLDFHESSEERNDFKRELAVTIADGVLEELVSDLVMVMADSLASDLSI